jgi:hypothetical protein
MRGWLKASSILTEFSFCFEKIEFDFLLGIRNFNYKLYNIFTDFLTFQAIDFYCVLTNEFSPNSFPC